MDVRASRSSRSSASRRAGPGSARGRGHGPPARRRGRLGAHDARSDAALDPRRRRRVPPSSCRRPKCVRVAPPRGSTPRSRSADRARSSPCCARRSPRSPSPAICRGAPASGCSITSRRSGNATAPSRPDLRARRLALRRSRMQRPAQLARSPHRLSLSGWGRRTHPNRVTVCVAHHLRGIHTFSRASGRAPDAIRWDLGLRRDGPPLLRLLGDRYVGPERIV